MTGAIVIYCGGRKVLANQVGAFWRCSWCGQLLRLVSPDFRGIEDA